MPCLATVMEDGTAFMCSTALLPSVCACGAPGVYLCDWPEMRWDQACCEAHVREVDDERHYCREHWSAWETVQ